MNKQDISKKLLDFLQYSEDFSLTKNFINVFEDVSKKDITVYNFKQWLDYEISGILNERRHSEKPDYYYQIPFTNLIEYTKKNIIYKNIIYKTKCILYRYYITCIL